MVRVRILAGQLSIGEALTAHLRHKQGEAISVSQFVVLRCPVVVTEHLFIEVMVKMERFDRHIRPAQSPFQQAPKVLYSVRVNLPTHIFPRVIDYLVNEVIAQSVISHSLIGVHLGERCDIIQNRVLQRLTLHIGQNTGSHLPQIAVKHPMDCCLANINISAHTLAALCMVSCQAGLVHLPRIRPDKGFIALDGTAKAELVGPVVLHRFPNPMKHKPCRVLANR